MHIGLKSTVITVYFLLFSCRLNGEHAIYTLAVVTFSVGLVNEEVIQTLISFTKEKLANKDNSTNDISTTKSVVLEDNKFEKTSKEKDDENK